MTIRIEGYFHETPSMQIICAARIAAHGILCIGVLDAPLGGKDLILLGDEIAKKPYLGIAYTEGAVAYTALILTSERPERFAALNAVTLRRANVETPWQFAEAFPLGAYAPTLKRYLAGAAPNTRRKLLFLMQGFVTSQPKLVTDPLAAAAMWEMRQACTDADASVLRTHWLLPNVAYLDLRMPYAAYRDLALVATTAKGQFHANLEILPVPPGVLDRDGRYDRAVGVALFETDVRGHLGKADLTIAGKDSLLIVEGRLPMQPVNTAQLLADLSAMPADFRLQLREHLCATLLDQRVPLNRFEAAALVRNLQFYLPAQHTTAADPRHPFGMNIESCVPLGNDAVFISGWLRDPLGHLESITAISDLGFSFPVDGQLRFFPRNDVDALYAEGPYAGMRGAWGFVATLKILPEVVKRLKGIAELHGFRFKVMLKGGLQYSISPPPFAADPFALRQALLDGFARKVGPATPEAETSVHEALAHVQTACMKAVGAPRVERFAGDRPAAKPEVSVVIPLYRCLDYLAAQVAHFSNDPLISQVEIVYVLDSPEQEEEVRDRLRNLSALYGLPLTLAVMPRNGGYAAASNAGAKLAKAPILLFLNSDVLPAAYGWMAPLAERLQQDGVGATGPMLLYEDGSIQHAGMYFAEDTASDHVMNRHYYKGYPANFAAARETRIVPALTGACLMVARRSFEKVGGFSTDYIIGDYEDSDLCLKLRREGLSCLYCGDVALYHLERQSMERHDGYREGAAYRYNALLHHRRWSGPIADLSEAA